MGEEEEEKKEKVWDLRDLKEAFKILDKDGSGGINTDEFLFIFKNIKGLDFSEDELNEIIIAADKDDDGEIAEREFIDFMRGKDTKQFGGEKLLIEMKNSLSKYLEL